MSESRNSTQPAKRAEATKSELEENSIGPTRRRAKTVAALPQAAQPEQSKPATRKPWSPFSAITPRCSICPCTMGTGARR